MRWDTQERLDAVTGLLMAIIGLLVSVAVVVGATLGLVWLIVKVAKEAWSG